MKSEGSAPEGDFRSVTHDPQPLFGPLRASPRRIRRRLARRPLRRSAPGSGSRPAERRAGPALPPHDPPRRGRGRPSGAAQCPRPPPTSHGTREVARAPIDDAEVELERGPPWTELAPFEEASEALRASRRSPPRGTRPGLVRARCCLPESSRRSGSAARRRHGRGRSPGPSATPRRRASTGRARPVARGGSALHSARNARPLAPWTEPSASQGPRAGQPPTGSGPGAADKSGLSRRLSSRLLAPHSRHRAHENRARWLGQGHARWRDVSRDRDRAGGT